MVQPEDGSNALRPFASYPRQIPALLEQGAPIVAALAAAAVAMGDLGPLLPTGTRALFLALTLLLLGLFRRRIDQDPTTTPPPPHDVSQVGRYWRLARSSSMSQTPEWACSPRWEWAWRALTCCVPVNT